MSLAALNLVEFPEYWDKLFVGDVISPGYCEWSGWERQYDFDEKKGKGTQGATLTYTQRPLAKGEFTFFFWDNGTLGTGHNHFQEMEDFLPLLKFDPTKKKITAIGVFHPALDAIEVVSVVCDNIGAPEVKGNGLCSIKCHFIEYNPTSNKSAVSTPDTTTTPSTVTTPSEDANASGAAATDNLNEQAGPP